MSQNAAEGNAAFVIWSNECLDWDNWSEAFEEDYANLTEEEKYRLMEERNGDYLGFRGEVVESVEYKSEESFLTDLKERLNCGVPLCVTLYRDQNGKTISRNFLAEVDTPPKRVSVEDVPSQTPKDRRDAR